MSPDCWQTWRRERRTRVHEYANLKSFLITFARPIYSSRRTVSTIISTRTQCGRRRIPHCKGEYKYKLTHRSPLVAPSSSASATALERSLIQDPPYDDPPPDDPPNDPPDDPLPDDPAPLDSHLVRTRDPLFGISGTHQCSHASKTRDMRQRGRCKTRLNTTTSHTMPRIRHDGC